MLQANTMQSLCQLLPRATANTASWQTPQLRHILPQFAAPALQHNGIILITC